MKRHQPDDMFSFESKFPRLHGKRFVIPIGHAHSKRFLTAPLIHQGSAVIQVPARLLRTLAKNPSPLEISDAPGGASLHSGAPVKCSTYMAATRSQIRRGFAEKRCCVGGLRLVPWLSDDLRCGWPIRRKINLRQINGS